MFFRKSPVGMLRLIQFTRIILHILLHEIAVFSPVSLLTSPFPVNWNY